MEWKESAGRHDPMKQRLAGALGLRRERCTREKRGWSAWARRLACRDERALVYLSQSTGRVLLWSNTGDEEGLLVRSTHVQGVQE